MNCKRADIYAERYEYGELNIVERRKFEKHIKECEVCRKKYATILLLGGILYASEKSAIQPALSFSWYIKQAAAVVAAAAAITTAVVIVNEMRDEKPAVINSGTVKNNSFGKDMKTDGSESKTGLIEENKKSDKIRIISKDAEKEIELNLDSRNLKIETRNER